MCKQKPDKVTEEEWDTPLYYWASVFKAQTWKELMILAEKSESIKKAVLKLHELTGEEKVRLQCEQSRRTGKEIARIIEKERSIFKRIRK
ncbi:MAG: hypothetical protein V8T31_06290 [Lachnospiraceae bacterium]